MFASVAHAHKALEREFAEMAEALDRAWEDGYASSGRNQMRVLRWARVRRGVPPLRVG